MIEFEYVREDDEKITFGKDVFSVIDMDGIFSLSPEVFTKKKAVGNGSVVTGYRIPEREIFCDAELLDYRENDTRRDILQRFFNPNYKFDVYVTYNKVRRYAKGCSLLKLEFPSKNQYQALRVKVRMLYPDSFFLSVDKFGADIAQVHGGFRFPYVNPVGKKFAVGLREFGTTVILENDGDVETYFRFEITFTGNVTNPFVQRGSSYIKILGTFEDGDELVIDTFEKTAELNGNSVSTRVDKGSRWNDLILGLGTNEIQYSADDGAPFMSVHVFFNKRYLGV
ncbi:MAG: phage tail family protein [Clostridia bacterium]|nr:phage tail family protein [Clostridia bacterium]